MLKLSNNLKGLNEELLKDLIIGFSSIFILIISLSKTVVILHVYVCLYINTILSLIIFVCFYIAEL